jgi:hypothetical protein
VLAMRLGGTPEDLRVVLCLEAHCDDIEIGCGVKLNTTQCTDRPGCSLVSRSSVSPPQRAEEARLGSCSFLAAAGEKRITSD